MHVPAHVCNVCMFIHMHVWDVHAYVYMYVYVHACVHVYMRNSVPEAVPKSAGGLNLVLHAVCLAFFLNAIIIPAGKERAGGAAGTAYARAPRLRQRLSRSAQTLRHACQRGVGRHVCLVVLSARCAFPGAQAFVCAAVSSE